MEDPESELGVTISTRIAFGSEDRVRLDEIGVTVASMNPDDDDYFQVHMGGFDIVNVDVSLTSADHRLMIRSDKPYIKHTFSVSNKAKKLWDSCSPFALLRGHQGGLV